MRIRTVLLGLGIVANLIGGCGKDDRPQGKEASSDRTARVAPGQVPKVLQTTPAADATDVDPGLSQIIVTYDIPMKPEWSVVAVGDAKTPELAGDDPITFRDEKTCVIKVKLQPNTAYGVGFNSKTRQGFKSANDGTPAELYQLRFRTGSGKAPAAKAPPAAPDGPRVVKTNPTNGARDLEAGTFNLTIVFSEPMKKGMASINTPDEGPRLKLIGKPSWKDARTFVTPIMLAKATTYRVGINTGRSKGFVSAGDGTPAVPLELVFSTTGAKPPTVSAKAPPAAVTTAPAPTPPKPPAVTVAPPPPPGGPVQLRYNYQKGDTGSVTHTNIVDLKLKLSSGQTVPLVHKVGVNCVEEVLTAEDGRPGEVRKLISEFIHLSTDPQTGQTQAAPRLGKGVEVKIDRRTDPPGVQTISGQVPQELMTVLREDTFLDVIPHKPIRVGETASLPPEAISEIKSAFDAKGTGKLDMKVTCERMGPLEVADARNEMFRAKGGGEPITYVFNVAEIGIAMKQEGTMENDIPFSLDAKGRIVFAIEAGILLKLSFEGNITVKPTQTQGQDGKPVTVTGGGPFTYKYRFEPLNWTRGATRKGQAAMAPPKRDAGRATPTPDAAGPMGTPKGSITHQLGLLNAGDAVALRACFTDRVRNEITSDRVKSGQVQAKNYTLDDLVGEVVEGEGLGKRTAKVKMKNGRTLTTLVLTDGKWLADTVWFR